MLTAAPDEAKTKEVLDHHWNTFQANDLDGVMADYTEESVLITPDKTVSGLTELRKHFSDVFLLFPKDSTTLKLDKSVVNKDVAYIVWSADAPKIDITYGTDTFIIKDGKIVRQTYAGVATMTP
jgi:ketosteroid isomerase-like protein